jgi:GT2 family glycosyltransferase
VTPPGRVAIVTINWNGLAQTRACLDSLRDLDPKRHMVLVIDNGSRGEQATTLAREYPWVRVLPQQSNLGFTGGCNVGIDVALAEGYDSVLLLNNDVVVEPGFLEPLLTFQAATPDAGAVGPVMLYGPGDRVWSAGGHVSLITGFTVVEGKGRSADDYPTGSPFATDLIAGACLLVSTDLIRRVGSLDDRYFAYYEDLDWCARFRAVGRRCYTVPASRIRHDKSASTGIAGSNKLAPIAAYYMSRNAFIFARAHLHGPRLLLFLGAQLAVRAPYNLLVRTGPRARVAYLRGLADGLAGRSGRAPVRD